MFSVRNETVVDEEACQLMCFLASKYNCTGYVLDNASLLCQLFIVDFNSTDVEPL